MVSINPNVLPGRPQAPGPYGSVRPNAGQTVQELVAAILGLSQYGRGFQGAFGQAASAAPAAELASLRSGVVPGAASRLGATGLSAAAPPKIDTAAGLLDAAASGKVAEFQQRRLLEEYLRLIAENDPSFLEKYGSTIGVLLGAVTGGLGFGLAGANLGASLGGAAGSAIAR